MAYANTSTQLVIDHASSCDHNSKQRAIKNGVWIELVVQVAKLFH